MSAKATTYPDAFVTVYMPVAGWKSMLLMRDDECGGMHTPHGTGSFAYATKAEAIRDAENWAEAEELPFIDVDPENTADAPDESVSDQIAKALRITK